MFDRLFLVVTSLLGKKSYIFGKPDYSPLQRCHTCEEHAFVGRAAEPESNSFILPSTLADGKRQEQLPEVGTIPHTSLKVQQARGRRRVEFTERTETFRDQEVLAKASPRSQTRLRFSVLSLKKKVEKPRMEEFLQEEAKAPRAPLV